MSMSAKELLAAGSLLLALGAGGVSAARAAAPAAPTLKFTVLYDNYVFKEGTKADWGFSCLIEGAEKTILFDTGTKPGILSYNVAALGVDLKQVDLVVLSHAHEDHTGGLPAVLGVKPGVEVLFPVSFGTAFAGKVAKAGAKPRPVADSLSRPAARTPASSVSSSGPRRYGIGRSISSSAASIS
jgi:glyoxylase-like metal-dependent hydrolase (beta-lactamase superfamily II)